MKKIIYSLVVLSSVFFVFQFVQAGPLDMANENLNKAVGSVGFTRDVGTSIGTVVKALLSVVGTIFLLLTIYAGVLWMTAQGNEEKAGEAQGIIRSAVIGLFVVMAAYAITAFVSSKVGGVGNGRGSQTCGSQGGMCLDPYTISGVGQVDAGTYCTQRGQGADVKFPPNGGQILSNSDCTDTQVCCLPNP